MARLRLFEFNDQPWLPAPLRKGMTDYLAGISRLAKMHEKMAPHLNRALQDSGAERGVDLCSGSGGPHEDLRPLLDRNVNVVCTSPRWC